MKIRYYGQSAVQLSHRNMSLIIDPFLTGNPLTQVKPRNIHVQYILVTHGHFDHIGDTLKLAKQNRATVIAEYELAEYLTRQGVNTFSMNIGGPAQFPFGSVELTQALHSSSIIQAKPFKITYTGSPVGFLIRMAGRTIYHAGDTGLFLDMKGVIGARNRIDVAFLPIGGVYTMNPPQAVQAAKWVRPKLTIPIHYNTFPVIRQNPNRFVASLRKNGLRGVVLNPDQSMQI